MRKKYKIEVDCANCASKIEDAICKINGVNDVSISFMTQKIIIDADDSCFDSVIKQAQKFALRLTLTAELLFKDLIKEISI